MNPERNGQDLSYEIFVSLLTKFEPQLRRFIRTLLPSWGDVDEVMQRTALAAWRKFAHFEIGSDFLKWALIVARFEALAFRRSMARDRHVFSDALLELMADEAALEAEVARHEERALEECLSKLEPERRELILKAYGPGVDQRDLAEDLGRSPAALYMLLSRIRKDLARCIEHKLNQHFAA
ncbi:MAG: sigma-70 family RNA polymerase sigma factor [Verrucomicrobiota bacterium]